MGERVLLGLLDPTMVLVPGITPKASHQTLRPWCGDRSEQNGEVVFTSFAPARPPHTDTPLAALTLYLPDGGCPNPRAALAAQDALALHSPRAPDFPSCYPHQN